VRWRSASLIGLCPFLTTQSKPFTASVAYFYLRPADVAVAGAAHPNVCGYVHFAALASLFPRLRKPNQISRFRCTLFAKPILTHQIFSPFMLLLAPRNTCLCCGCALLILCSLSRCRRSRQHRTTLHRILQRRTNPTAHKLTANMTALYRLIAY
jgi:hypothetical protein